MRRSGLNIRNSDSLIREPHDFLYNLARGSLLAKNTVFNLLGQVVPMAAAFLSIPIIIRGLGTERFGVLSLVWMIVGYFSLFDMGIGRATKKYVAEYLGRGEIEELPKLVWTSISMLAAFGAIAAILLAAFNPLLVVRVLNLPEALKPETIKALYLLALSLPLTLGSNGAMGVLEAQQRFDLVNAIKVPASILSFVTPLMVLPFSKSLYPITAVLLVNRLAVFAIYFYLCLKHTPNMKRVAFPEIAYLKELLGFGGWLTVSNIISPFMAYMDRFIVASVLTMSAVAYYSTPYDMITKLWIIPGGLIGVVFPALSATFEADTERFVLLYERSSKYIMMTLSPVILIIVTFAAPFLKFWLGATFAVESAMVLQLLAVGILLNSIGMVPYAAIQAMGRPDLTAKLHMIELPVYLGMIWFFIGKIGIDGVAMCWSLRVAVDTILLCWFARKTAAARCKLKNRSLLPLACITTGLLLMIYATIMLDSLMSISILLALCLSFMIAAFLHFLIETDERAAIVSLLGTKKFSI